MDYSSTQLNQLIQKLWNYCNILRDDGLSYGDYPSASSGQAPAVDVYTLSQNGGRAEPGAVQQAVTDSERLRLAKSAEVTAMR